MLLSAILPGAAIFHIHLYYANPVVVPPPNGNSAGIRTEHYYYYSSLIKSPTFECLR